MSKNSAVGTLSGPDKKQQEDWAAEDDVRTLVRAAEIEKDKPRLAHARAKAKEQLAALASATK